MYDYLVDFYFRVREGSKETKPAPVETKPVPATKEKGKQEELPQIDDPIGIFNILLKVAEDKQISVKSYPFKYYASQLCGNVIGIRQGVTVEKACYELAWELAHVFIHYDCGDIVKSPLAKDYNEQATRAAEMIIKILNIKMTQI